MPKTMVRRHTKWLFLSLFIIVLDQYCKGLVSHYLALSETVDIFPCFSLTLMHNTGAAFSFLDNASGWQRWFFITLGIIVSLIIIIMLIKRSASSVQRVSGLALILGGAIGNMYDRIIHGYVIDFLLLYIKDYQWPVFNIADTVICLGVFMLFFDLFAGDED